MVATAELLPHCQKLAEDICSADPATLKEVHRLIDFGWRNTVAEGLAEEKLASNQHKDHLTADYLEERRIEVVTRGREESRR